MTTGLRLGSAALRLPLAASALAALSLVASAAPVDLADDMDTVIRHLDLGEDEEALAALRAILAQDPSQEEAYELWKNTESRVWTRLLVKGGQFEIGVGHLMNLARLQRGALSRDEDAIRGRWARATGNDIVDRRRAINELGAQNGEFAVPFALRALADPNDDDRRALTMTALTDMGTDVVLPLIESLRSSDEYLRRNVALSLGYIGDARAAGALAWQAATDPDATARSAAQQALERIGAGSSALDNLLALGEGYLTGADHLTGEGLTSDVVWSFGGGSLTATDVPRAIWRYEMAKKNFYDALSADPASGAALAGLARSYVAQTAELEAWQSAGADVDELLEQSRTGLLAIEVVGVDSCDAALAAAMERGDDAGAIGLCRVLGHGAAAPSAALLAAVGSDSASVRAEAAVAVGSICARTGRTAEPEVVSVLAETSGREIVRIAAVIGPRGRQVAQALRERGVLTNTFARGAQALGSLRRMPGVDIIAVADILPDLTAHQVVADVQGDERFANVPLFIVSDSDDLGDAFSSAAGVVASDASDMGPIDDALEAELTGARAEADRLAAHAAHALASLARSGHTDVSAALEDLAASTGRRDDVAIPAMAALGAAGTLEQGRSLLGIVADGGRSDAARAAAADALAGIYSRDNGVGADAVEALHQVLVSDADLSVRQSTARAMSRLALAPEVRAEVLRAVRVDIGR